MKGGVIGFLLLVGGALLLRSTALSVLAMRGVVLDVLVFVTVVWSLRHGEEAGDIGRAAGAPEPLAARVVAVIATRQVILANLERVGVDVLLTIQRHPTEKAVGKGALDQIRGKSRQNVQRAYFCRRQFVRFAPVRGKHPKQHA